ncbi:MAG: hypothetical protein A4E35_00227 [Methanoregula sp. PtaU1.Bin051]|nr:MAG: hypothetical protein A4E35_00227 [Methanoregula sp. PtaU1.Bin051]
MTGEDSGRDWTAGALADAAKDWIAIDGLWFQAVEQAYGMDVAVALDCKVWEQFAAIEAGRIKKRLKLPEAGGLSSLDAALRARLVHNVNTFTIERPDSHTLVFTITGCRVQSARQRKKMALFPCRPVGLTEFPAFARAIDPRIRTECLSCPPDTLPGVPYCRWRFTM